MSSQNITPKYLQQEEALEQELKELISTLPKQKGWFDSSYVYLYQGFWYQPDHLQSILSCQKHFQAQDSDVFLITYPKCGTTWMKAIIFTLLNRQHYSPFSKSHPLLTHNPHELILSLEINLYADVNRILNPDPSSFHSRRFFSTHMPHASLPGSAKSSPGCKLVYACRDAKDAFVSLWHFMNKLRPRGSAEKGVEEALGMFCEGVIGFGPFWDHVLEYWEQSRVNPERVLFVMYEDMKVDGEAQLRRLAEFLDCPFSEEEEELGVVDEILKLTSFESMTGFEVNKKGKLENGMENSHFFRKGVVGDWENYLTKEMVEKLDGIVQDKFLGSGLVM